MRYSRPKKRETGTHLHLPEGVPPYFCIECKRYHKPGTKIFAEHRELAEGYGKIWTGTKWVSV